MTGRRRLARLAGAAGVAGGAAAAYVFACGPFVTMMRPVETVRPGRVAAFDRGEVGVVREHFARRYLVQGFRRFNGRTAIVVAPSPTGAIEAGVAQAIKEWRAFRQTATGNDLALDIDADRSLGNYQSMPNCLRDTFVKALATARARAETYGLTSPQMRDWVKAEDAVLSNCSGGMTLPDPPPAGADTLTRADRAYQTASAYFYGEDYDKAADLFQKIAADTASPWRPYGRYLAGRARLRQATLADPLDKAALRAAQVELRATLADPGAAFLHKSAAGLLDFVTYRTDPAKLLHDLTATLGSADAATPEQVDSYERLLDGFLGDDVRYDYADVKDRDAIVRSGELSDWILVMQGTGDAAVARAVEQWKRTGSPAWLAAALWKVPPRYQEAPAILDAAARVASTSPAYSTIGFLRVRLLAARGEADQARAVLAALPRTPAGEGDTETVNLLNAERFMLARSLDELLDVAPRFIVSERLDMSSWRDPDENTDPGPLKRDPVFDDDAALVFSRRLPLTRLVEAATSTKLPPRLRLRVASAAFARAWMLDRMDEAVKVAPVLRTLSPSAAADVRAFENAAQADRHVAGLRLLLRTPGIRANVKGVEDDEDYNQKGLSREFDHLFRRNWWCAFGKQENDWPTADSELLKALYASAEPPSPSFLSSDERAAVDRERQALVALGTAPNYLAGEAVQWAKARPKDLDAAEALAHAVEGTRWGCTNERTTDASRTAFQTLHQLFPRTEWALKTKYWY